MKRGALSIIASSFIANVSSQRATVPLQILKAWGMKSKVLLTMIPCMPVTIIIGRFSKVRHFFMSEMSFPLNLSILGSIHGVDICACMYFCA